MHPHPPPHVCCSYQGANASAGPGDFAFAPAIATVASIWMPSGYNVMLYNLPNFWGGYVLLTQNVSCLQGSGVQAIKDLNGTISSYRISSGEGVRRAQTRQWEVLVLHSAAWRSVHICPHAGMPAADTS